MRTPLFGKISGLVRDATTHCPKRAYPRIAGTYINPPARPIFDGAQQAAEPPPRRAAEAQHSQGRPVPVGRYSRQRGLQRRRQAGIPGSVHHGTLHYLQFANHTSTAQECGALSSGLRSPYWGLSGARNWELIQPFPRVFSTWTQSPSRPVAVNCVPLGAVPTTGAFAEGADLMLTPGRCKKTRSGFCAVEAVWGVTAPTWGEAAAVSEAATSGEGTTHSGRWLSHSRSRLHPSLG